MKISSLEVGAPKYPVCSIIILSGERSPPSIPVSISVFTNPVWNYYLFVFAFCERRMIKHALKGAAQIFPPPGTTDRLRQRSCTNNPPTAPPSTSPPRIRAPVPAVARPRPPRRRPVPHVGEETAPAPSRWERPGVRGSGAAAAPGANKKAGTFIKGNKRSMMTSTDGPRAASGGDSGKGGRMFCRPSFQNVFLV